MSPDIERRAKIYATLGEPVRLAIIDDLADTDRSPKDLAERHGLPTNLLAHHLDVLESTGLIVRFTSAGDRRRRYVRLVHEPVMTRRAATLRPAGNVLFLCTHNSARSQLAAALWTARTGEPAESAGTHPVARVHRGAIAAGHRAGLDLSVSVPRLIGYVDPGTQVVTVCDRAHEELDPAEGWWHWSIPDPVDTGTAAAFDAVVADLDTRIHSILN